MTTTPLILISLWIVNVVLILGFGVLPLAYRFSKRPTALALTQAQKASIKYHHAATISNSIGLALGIILVFYGGTLDDRFLTSGVIAVLGSIFSFVIYEQMAFTYDKQVSELLTTADIDLLGKIEMLLNKPIVDLKDAKLAVKIPRLSHLELGKDKLTFCYEEENKATQTRTASV